MQRFRVSIRVAAAALALVCLMIAFTGVTETVYARTSDATLVQKAQKQGVKDCYNAGVIEPEVKTVNTTASPNTLYFRDVVSKASSPQVLLPYSLTNIVDNNISCNELFFGYNNRNTLGYRWFGAGGSINGLENNTNNIGNGMITNPRAVETFMSALGYTRNGGSDDDDSYGNCVTISISYHPFGGYKGQSADGSGAVCFDFSSNGGTRLSEGYRAGIDIGMGLTLMETATQGEMLICPYTGYTQCEAVVVSGLTTAQNAATAIKNAITGSSFYDPTRQDDTFYVTQIETSGGDVTESDMQSGTYTRGSLSTMFNSIFGTTSTDTDYTYSELYDLYVNYYLRNGYNATISCVDPGDTDALQIAQATLGTGIGQYRQVTLYYNGEMNDTCFAKSTKANTSEPMYVAAGNGNGQRHLATSVNFDGLINAINTLAKEAPNRFEQILGTAGMPGAEDDPNISTEFKDTDNQQNSSENISGSADSVIDVCFANANSLGWILCPVIKLIGNAVEFLYENVVSGFLEVKANLLSTSSGNNGIYGGWKRFRDFANVLFAIVFVIVILAQMTGIGITNYNIKKILPRLIVVVVMTNLSFILCQLAVDVSNILGDQLYNLFDGWASQVTLSSDMTGYTPSYLVGQILIVLGLGAVIHNGTVPAVIAGALSTSTGIWLPLLLLAILGILIGILFFFILLGVRQAGVLILVIISPLAVICYALPNTKTLFDRWRKALTSLLLLYPICGAMMGGTQFVSALLLSAGGDEGFFFVLVAMLLGVVPFFLIPSILRSSMAALGRVGTSIATAGQRFNTGLRRAAIGSMLYKDFQRNLGMGDDKRTYERLSAKKARNGGKLNRYDTRRMAAAGARFRKATEENEVAAAEIADGSRGLPVEGSAELERIRAGITSQREMRDAGDMEKQYQAGTVSSYDTSVGKVDLSDIRADDAGNYMDTGVAKELSAVLDRLDVDPTNSAAKARMRALVSYLSTQSEDGQVLIKQVMKSRVRGGRFRTDQNGHGVEGGLSMMAQAISADGGFMKSIKEDDKGLLSLVGDMRRKDYSAHGNMSVDDYYGMQGAGSYDAQKLGGANADAIISLTHAVSSGNITGDKLRKLVTVAREALENKNVHLKGNNRELLEKLVASSYSPGGARVDASNPSLMRGWEGSTADIRTDGSRAIADASTAEIQSMINQLDAFNNGATFNVSQQATWSPEVHQQYTTVQSIAENIRRVLNDASNPQSPEKVELMQSYLEAAGAKGVRRAASATSTGGQQTGTAYAADSTYTREDSPVFRVERPRSARLIDPNSLPQGASQVMIDEMEKENARRQIFNIEHGYQANGDDQSTPPPPPPPAP